jgi:CDP-diacylglycerol--glycerol-3-phosphate 3-phosphatidyltransferase
VARAGARSAWSDGRLKELRELFRRTAVGLSTMVAGSLSSARDGIARGITRAGIPVNAVTLAGALVATVVFLPAYYGNQPLAGVVLIVAGAFDVLDGAVARLSRGVTPFGGYLDSVVDRYSDFAVFFGILVYVDRYWDGPLRLLYLILWGLCVVGTSTTAYVRARAETVIPRCKVGFMERPERMVTVILGLLSGNVHLSLWILAVMTNLISIQRILYTRVRMDGGEPGGRFWFWTYGRVTAPHFAMCTAFILILVFGHYLIARP